MQKKSHIPYRFRVNSIVFFPYILLSLIISCGSFPKAVQDNNINEVRKFIQSGYNLNGEFKISGAITNFLYTPLIWAVETSNAEIISILIESGANVNGKTTDKGQTALHSATYLRNEEAVLLLLNAGADINSKNLSDTTPLGLAVSSGLLKMTNFLMERGADISTKDLSGKTPIERAKENKIIWTQNGDKEQEKIYKEIIQMLEKKSEKSKLVIFRAKITNSQNDNITIFSPASSKVRVGFPIEFQNESGKKTGEGKITELFHTNIKAKKTSGTPVKGDYAVIYSR